MINAQRVLYRSMMEGEGRSKKKFLSLGLFLKADGCKTGGDSGSGGVNNALVAFAQYCVNRNRSSFGIHHHHRKVHT